MVTTGPIPEGNVLSFWIPDSKCGRSYKWNLKKTQSQSKLFIILNNCNIVIYQLQCKLLSTLKGTEHFLSLYKVIVIWSEQKNNQINENFICTSQEGGCAR